jgi:peptidoglycan/LPS O-acetylase OafA/YrhL
MKHFGQLDGLRAIAVSLVFVNHLWLPTSYLGQLGVRLFFVLSGFLITGILLEAKDSARISESLKTFYARRFLRIFPLYYMVLAVLAITNAPRVREFLPWHVLYATNILIARIGDWSILGTDHFWSLAVEEQFYLLWPFVILLTPRSMLRNTMITLIAGSVAFRLLGRFVFHWGYTPTHVLLFGCVDALALGALLAHESEAGRDRIQRVGMFFIPVLAAVIALTFADWGTKIVWTFFEFSAAICSAALIRAALRGIPGIWGRFLSNPAVAYIGVISYGLYVYHMPIRTYVTANSMAVIFLSLLIASLSWFIYEKPINDLKRYFPYKRVSREPKPSGGVATA